MGGVAIDVLNEVSRLEAGLGPLDAYLQAIERARGVRLEVDLRDLLAPTSAG